MIDIAKGKKHGRKRKGGGKVVASNHGHVPVFQRQEYRPFQGTIHVAGMVCRSTETCYSATVFACFFPTSTTLLWPFHGKQQAYPPILLAQTPPTPVPCLPLARHHPSSVGLYKYTIVLILYLFPPPTLFLSFCSPSILVLHFSRFRETTNVHRVC